MDIPTLMTIVTVLT